MNPILAYLRKYSSPSHVVILAITGIVLLVKGQDWLGADYFTALPYLAFGMAAIEIIVLVTKPKSDKEAQ